MHHHRASHPNRFLSLFLLTLSVLLCGACSKGEAPAGAEAPAEMAYQVSWELTQTEPSCEEECEAKMAVILEAPGAEPKRLEVKIEDLTFNRETDSYGACSGEEKGKGLLCAGVNFSCGDNCYQDKLYLAQTYAEGATVLELRHFASCMGGQECPEESAVLFTHPLDSGASVRAKKKELNPAAEAQKIAKSFTQATLESRFDPDEPFRIVIDGRKTTVKNWSRAKKALAKSFGRSSFSDWDDFYDEDYEGYHVEAWSEPWACDKVGCCRPADPDWGPSCAGSSSPTPLEELCFHQRANGALALRKIDFSSYCDDNE